VSARRENNATTWFRILAGKDGIIRIRDNFGGRAPKGFRKVGDNFEVTLKKGAIIEATLPKLATIPEAPANVAEPVIVHSVSGITANTLPVRIGADSNGGSRFVGDIARVFVAGRALSTEEIAALADRTNAGWDQIKGVVIALEGGRPVKLIESVQVLPADGGLTGKMYRFDGKGYLEIPHRAALNGTTGLTLAAWVRPAGEPPAMGMRIIDKSPVGSAQGYLLDTYPKDSLRLITREPHLIFPAKLPVGQWTHVAATVDGATGKQTLFLNGHPVTK
jgi:hypothetical protein